LSSFAHLVALFHGRLSGPAVVHFFAVTAALLRNTKTKNGPIRTRRATTDFSFIYLVIDLLAVEGEGLRPDSTHGRTTIVTNRKNDFKKTYGDDI